MRHLVIIIFLAFVWLALIMKFTLGNFIIGLLLSFLIMGFMCRKDKDDNQFYKKPLIIIIYLLFFLKEVVKGSIRIAWDIITPKHYMNPGIIAVPLDAKTDWEITLFANSITLTPGTTSIAVSKDKTILYVYSVYIDKNPQHTINSLKNGLEKKLLEALR